MMRTALLALAIITILGGGSYRRLSADDEARFYRTGAAGFVGRSVHLHLAPAPFLKPPEEVRPAAAASPYHLYSYRGVKFLVHPRNPYYEQFRRKRKSGKVVCVKGKVVRYGGAIGVAVLIHRIRAVPKPRRARRS